jgi:hypothetical protein
MRGPLKFKLRDVTRACRGVRKAGLEVARVEVAKDGSIIVIPGKPQEATHDANGERNEWDDVA